MLILCFRQANRSFMRKKVLKTNLSAAQPAAPNENNAKIAANGYPVRCIRQFAASAERRRKFPLSLARIGRFFAGNASRANAARGESERLKSLMSNLV